MPMLSVHCTRDRYVYRVGCSNHSYDICFKALQRYKSRQASENAVGKQAQHAVSQHAEEMSYPSRLINQNKSQTSFEDSRDPRTMRWICRGWG